MKRPALLCLRDLLICRNGLGSSLNVSLHLFLVNDASEELKSKAHIIDVWSTSAALTRSSLTLIDFEL